MRFYGEVPPWLGAGVAPAVSSASGLGTGGGASVQTEDGTGFGKIDVMTGTNPSTGGSVAITFAATPPVLFISGDDTFGTLSQATVGDVVTISWTAKPQASKRLHLHYEWASSY